MMKKAVAIILSLALVLCLTACGNTAEDAEGSGTADLESSTSTGNQPEEAENPEAEDAEKPETEDSRMLVVYFSATGTTESVAEHIAKGLDSDLYEIVPKEPYTDTDLNYNDSSSRTTIEMNDPDSRPEISDTVENMEQYDVVFIGYPIWWGEAPRIISTFMESYDFSGKTIVPFCTSGSSGIDGSEANLKALVSDARWLDGQRFGGSASQDTVMEWVNSLDLVSEK